MQASELSQGVARIVGEDHFAVGLTCGLVLAQIGFYKWCKERSTEPLKRATKAIDGVANSTSRPERMREVVASSYPQLSAAWESIFGHANRESAVEDSGLAPEEALNAHELLPTEYNPRLDASAPGVFTALGIIGTFVGLILGFLSISPGGDATRSIQPLLGAMVVAFMNSLFGVIMSVVWTVRSRSMRHEFNIACERLIVAARRLRPNLTFEGRLLRQLEALTTETRASKDATSEQMSAIVSNLVSLRSQTQDSSQLLLDNLSSSVGEAFKAMVSMPFDRLQNSVLQFDDVVKATSERHQEIQQHFERAAERLQDAEAKLSAGIQLARECVEEFSVATMQLRESANNASLIVDKTHDAATSMTRVVEEVARIGDRYETLSTALDATTRGLESSATAMAVTAADMGSSTAQLEAALTTIRQASDDTIEHSAAAVRREMDQAVRVLVDGIRETGQQTVQAYEASSTRVVNAVDTKMSDLTDRLSAELTTLASRLPGEVESLNRAMDEIRKQITRATKSMDDAVRRLADQTPETLNRTLDTYDRALGQAMDHFNGTLQQWDAKVSVIEALTIEIRRLAGAGSSHHSSSPAQVIPT